jgi:hypothetical protein
MLNFPSPKKIIRQNFVLKISSCLKIIYIFVRPAIQLGYMGVTPECLENIKYLVHVTRKANFSRGEDGPFDPAPTNAPVVVLAVLR